MVLLLTSYMRKLYTDRVLFSFFLFFHNLFDVSTEGIFNAEPCSNSASSSFYSTNVALRTHEETGFSTPTPTHRLLLIRTGLFTNN